MRAKKDAGSSRREKLIVANEADIKSFLKTPDAKQMSRRLQKRGAEPTAADLNEIPLFGGVGQEAFRPIKQSVTIRLDADIVSWFRGKPGRYQTNLNDALRKVMEREQRKRTAG
jgi:uncharacterized protein (DUF4415 family)